MGHSYCSVYLHLVFSTKERRPLIPPPKQRLLHRYLAGIATNHNMKALEAGGMQDHIHLLISLSPDMAVAKAVNVLKSNSSKWMRAQVRGFAWQEGYAAFSVSVSALEDVAEYIRNQEQHHRKRDFAQEYIALLKKHGIVYDPRWVLG
jgi:REP element-mobilizing transposase RayT